MTGYSLSIPIIAALVAIGVVYLILKHKKSLVRVQKNHAEILDQVEAGLQFHNCLTAEDVLRKAEVHPGDSWLFSSKDNCFYNIDSNKKVSANQFSSMVDKQADIWPIIIADGEVSGFMIGDYSLISKQVGVAINTIQLKEKVVVGKKEQTELKDRIEKLLQLQGQFVSNVSHELRTPLTSIKAYSEALSMPGSDDELKAEFLSIINQESCRLESVVNNLLNLSKLEQGVVLHNRQKVDLVELVKSVETQLYSEIQRRSIDLVFEHSAPVIEFAVDAEMITQLVKQMLDNAFKFTPDRSTVKLILSEGVSAVTISVEDNGPGVPDSELTYLFDRFYQVDGSSTREHGGQGIGLTICKDIVESHQGRITAEKIKPQGMKFSAILPRINHVRKSNNVIGEVLTNTEQAQFVSELVHWIAESMQSRTVSIMLPSENADKLVIAAAMGLSDELVQNTTVKYGEGVAGKAWQSGSTVIVTENVSGREHYLTGSAISVPLIIHDEVIGVVNVTGKLNGQPYAKHEQYLLENIGCGIVENFKIANQFQRRKTEFSTLRETLQLAVAVRRAKNEKIIRACRELCMDLADRMNLANEEKADLLMAMQVYDLGFSAIPSQLINKSEPLQQAEWEMVQRHPEKSCQLAEVLRVSDGTLTIIKHLRERYDGSGYPNKLAGSEIHRGAKILSAIDALASMLQGRPWQKAMSLSDALSEIDLNRGKQFCPEVIANMQTEIVKQGFGISEQSSSLLSQCR